MKSILEELWYGNVGQSTGCRDATTAEKRLMGSIAKHHEELEATLTDKQKEIFEKFDGDYAELMEMSEREVFLYAFKLGARIAIEVLFPDFVV